MHVVAVDVMLALNSCHMRPHIVYLSPYTAVRNLSKASRFGNQISQ